VSSFGLTVNMLKYGHGQIYQRSGMVVVGVRMIAAGEGGSRTKENGSSCLGK
jgi:hypothetical protein